MRGIWCFGVLCLLSACTLGRAVSADALPGTSWQVVAIDGAAAVATDPARPLTIVFATDTVTGSSGVNRFNGTSTIDGAQLHIERVITTRRAAAEPAMTLERSMLAALNASATWTVNGDVLQLADATGRERLRAQRAAPAP